MALLCLLLMAAFYLAVIIGQPQEDETASTVTPRTDQPLLSAGQDVVTITSADDLPLLLRMFPRARIDANHLRVVARRRHML